MIEYIAEGKISSIRPRWHRLLVGPTGTGETQLATALAQKLGWPVLSPAVPDWILMGCTERGASTRQILPGWKDVGIEKRPVTIS